MLWTVWPLQFGHKHHATHFLVFLFIYFSNHLGYLRSSRLPIISDTSDHLGYHLGYFRSVLPIIAALSSQFSPGSIPALGLFYRLSAHATAPEHLLEPQPLRCFAALCSGSAADCLLFTSGAHFRCGDHLALCFLLLCFCTRNTAASLDRDSWQLLMLLPHLIVIHGSF